MSTSQSPSTAVTVPSRRMPTFARSREPMRVVKTARCSSLVSWSFTGRRMARLRAVACIETCTVMNFEP